MRILRSSLLSFGNNHIANNVTNGAATAIVPQH
jgi:hypothetical protein